MLLGRRWRRCQGECHLEGGEAEGAVLVGVSDRGRPLDRGHAEDLQGLERTAVCGVVVEDLNVGWGEGWGIAGVAGSIARSKVTSKLFGLGGTALIESDQSDSVPA